MQKMSSVLRREFFFLLAIVILSFVVRSFIFVTLLQKNNNSWVYPDSVQYYTTAQNIAVGHGITNDCGDPQLYRLPGYPLFLASGVLLNGDVIDHILWLQILLSCFVPILVFFLAQVLLPQAVLVAQIAALLSAVHMGFALYSGMIMTESLFLILLLLFFILFFRSYWGWAGIVLGIASLIRPVGLYVVMVALVVLLFENGYLLQRLRNGALLLCGWLIIIAPWLIRNFLLTGALFFHTLPGHHFLQYSAAYVVMERDHCSYGDVRPGLLAQWEKAIADKEQEMGKRLNDYQRCCIAESIASAIIKKHPWYALKTGLVQITKTCFGLYSAQPLLSDAYSWPNYDKDTALWTKIKRFLFPHVHHKVLILFVYFEIMMMLIMGIGLLFFMWSLLYNRLWRLMFIKTVPFLIVFIVITVGYGCARLRMPVEPFLIIFASAGWIWVLWRLSKKNEIF
jgi:4-amino-4-deoxy-L-arabinose transferase-like glycosyltransferase